VVGAERGYRTSVAGRGRNPERRDRNRKVPRIDARRARRKDAEEETERAEVVEKEDEEAKKGFENSRGEESSGWVVE